MRVVMAWRLSQINSATLASRKREKSRKGCFVGGISIALPLTVSFEASVVVSVETVSHGPDWSESSKVEFWASLIQKNSPQRFLISISRARDVRSVADNLLGISKVRWRSERT